MTALRQSSTVRTPWGNPQWMVLCVALALVCLIGLSSLLVADGMGVSGTAITVAIWLLLAIPAAVVGVASAGDPRGYRRMLAFIPATEAVAAGIWVLVTMAFGLGRGPGPHVGDSGPAYVGTAAFLAAVIAFATAAVSGSVGWVVGKSYLVRHSVQGRAVRWRLLAVALLIAYPFLLGAELILMSCGDAWCAKGSVWGLVLVLALPGGLVGLFGGFDRVPFARLLVVVSGAEAVMLSLWAVVGATWSWHLDPVKWGAGFALAGFLAGAACMSIGWVVSFIFQAASGRPHA